MTQGSPSIDPSLVKRAKRGDALAQESIYRAFAPMIYTLARRMLGARVLAEDIMQETFVEVLHKLGDVKQEAQLGAWIKRIATNKCLAHLRSPWSSRRVAATHPGAFEPVAVSSDPELALARALDALTPATRAVVWLHDVEGYTHKEIAARMGRSTSFSKSQLARAHERLRHLLEASPEDGDVPLCVHAWKTF